jgi:polygalacturonase
LLFSRFSFLLAVALSVTVLTLPAQDTRKVTEPHIPIACVTLEANIVANQGAIADKDEQRLDTERIQRAIDTCAAGQAVVLRAQGQKNVFLAGPITLRTGITLVVDADTVLVASRDPRAYDATPGSCGIVSNRGHGCKPLIMGDGAQHSGIMGDGSIDGRGGAKLLGQDVTWWDLAHEAKITDKQQSVPWLVVLHTPMTSRCTRSRCVTLRGTMSL